MTPTGKRNVGYPGIIDQRWNTDGSPSGYKGKKPYRAFCHFGDGEEAYSRSFSKLIGQGGAIEWKKDQELQHANRDNRTFLNRQTFKQLKDIKIRDIIFEYIHDTNKTRGREPDDLTDLTDLFSLHKIAQSWVGELSAFDIKKYNLEQYFNIDRARDTYTRKGWKTERLMTARGIRRELTMLVKVFNLAMIQNWFGVCHLINGGINPAHGIKIKGSSYQRRRILLPHEEEKLVANFEGCQGLNKYYVPLAMYLALHTGMRLGEVVNLRWCDVSYIKRRITITKSKIDHKLAGKGVEPGRVIVLPVEPMLLLAELWQSLNKDGTLPPRGNSIKVPNLVKPQDHPSSHIFINRYGRPLSSGALGDAFTDTVLRAKLEPLNGETPIFKDLRRTASDMFIKAGLDADERSIMRNGYVEGNLDNVYSYRETYLKRIQDKLDKYVLSKRVNDEYGDPIIGNDGNAIYKEVTLSEYLNGASNSDLWHGRVTMRKDNDHRYKSMWDDGKIRASIRAKFTKPKIELVHREYKSPLI